jgi:hypothetical protein
VIKIHERKQDDKNKMSFQGMASFYGGIFKKLKEGRDKNVNKQQGNQEPIN